MTEILMQVRPSKIKSLSERIVRKYFNGEVVSLHKPIGGKYYLVSTLDLAAILNSTLIKHFDKNMFYWFGVKNYKKVHLPNKSLPSIYRFLNKIKLHHQFKSKDAITVSGYYCELITLNTGYCSLLFFEVQKGFWALSIGDGNQSSS